MNMLKKILTAIGFATVAIIIGSSSALATIASCIEDNFSYLKTDNSDEDYQVECPAIEYNGETLHLYAESGEDCITAEELDDIIGDCDTEPDDSDSKKESDDSGGYGNIKPIDTFELGVNEGHKYPNLSTKEDLQHSVKCPAVKYTDETYVTFWGKSATDCASAAALVSGESSCATEPNSEFVENFKSCTGEGRRYPNLSVTGSTDKHKILCPINYNGIVTDVYTSTFADCGWLKTKGLPDDACVAPGHNHYVVDIIKIVLFIVLIASVGAAIIGPIFIIMKNKKDKKPTSSEPSEPEAQKQ